MSRLTKLRTKMTSEKFDAFLCMRPENRRYLSGFTGSAGMLLITQDQAFLLTDFRYLEQAAAQAPEFQVVKIGNEPFKTLAELDQGIEVLGFEGDFVTFEEYGKLEQNFARTRLVSRPELVNHLRSVKEPSEIELIREAVRIADDAFSEILQFISVGQTEAEIALHLEFSMRQAGASGPSFDFIAASGWRSAMPHGVASSKKVQQGEFLTLDYGAIYQGYCSDITRTVCLGEPDEKQRALYDTVLAANRAGIAAVRPGLTGKEVDAAARKLIEDAGYGEYFGHGLGHSVGLAIHEGPNLSPREERVLEPGMVVTVEPGIYLPDYGGVRIEDMVLVTEQGCEVLTKAPKDLIIIN
ncbi:aminopeptidase P family protein [Paradesulfitobacterium ferrireducens]|uniref:aminopeptidase P family protein n=1 Tax=Paradesulfitobacterium ferrireducens TaxID=2816476 RepID=UPI001A8BF989|nr:aminopeptidase P family protein [Paradesulfitobacterium ferrireducens]